MFLWRYYSDICTSQLMNITLARTAKKKAIDINKVHEWGTEKQINQLWKSEISVYEQSRSNILQLQSFIRSSPLRRRIKPDWSHRPAVPGPGSDPVRPPYITRPKPETGCCCDSSSPPRRGWYVVRQGGVWLHRRLPCCGVVVESVFVAVVMTGSVVESAGMHRIRRFCKSFLVRQASGCRYIQPTSCFISD